MRNKFIVGIFGFFIFVFGSLAKDLLERESSVSANFNFKNNVKAQVEGIIESGTVEAQQIETKEIVNFDTRLHWQSRINAFICEMSSPLCMNFELIDYSIEEAINYNIHPYTFWVLAFADTTLGKSLTTPHNLTNFGNTDSGMLTWFNDLKQNVLYSITLLSGDVNHRSNGKFKGNLSWATKLGDLTFGGQAILYGAVINNNVWATSWTNAPRNQAWAWAWLSENQIDYGSCIKLDYYI